MSPKAEFRELVARSRALVSAAALLLITFVLLIVAVAILFCSVWITVFRTAQGMADQLRAKVTIPELLR